MKTILTNEPAPSVAGLLRVCLALLFFSVAVAVAAPAVNVTSPTPDSFVLSDKFLSAEFRKGEKGGIIFAGLKTAGAEKTALLSEGSDVLSVELGNGSTLTSRDMTLKSWSTEDLPADRKAVRRSERESGKALHAVLQAKDGSFSVDWYAILRKNSHYLRQVFVITARRDTSFSSFTPLQYTFSKQAGVPSVSGNTTHGNLVVSERLFAGLESPMSQMSVSDSHTVQGKWVRRTTLPRGQSWVISSVVGLIEPGQARRSFLRYSERERAVPYRVFVHYNDWYEVGIRLHDNPDPLKRTTDAVWKGITDHWKRELFDKRKTYLDAFVIDDGWDEFNSLWDFHAGFPKGFANINSAASKMKAGIGTWLGPVGGYGSSKSMRLAYWNKNHPTHQINNFELSDKEYFDAFVGRCREMLKKYDMRYFKFDGISTAFHAKGPVNLEDAEGIIRVVTALRKTRPNLFVNATVGTWASPFWFHYVDSVWRQENDFGQLGTAGDARDKWITYRDHLVYEVFVQGAPLFPINCLMTHGTIITRNGPPHVMSTDPQNCIKEMRAAFGSGSGLQEIYAEADLLDQDNGRLWDELAACIAWIRRNSDVLSDVHWVGGNPWDGSEGCVYGWAAWNTRKCTLTLRNSDASPQTLTSTPRRIFDIPASNSNPITLRSSFPDQRSLPNITDTPLNPDDQITITLRPGEVIVMEGNVNRSNSATCP